MIKNDNGFTLYLILISIIASSFFVLTLYNGAFINVKLSKNITYQKKAFYAAEAAIGYSKIILQENSGIPLKNKNGVNYKEGEIYEKREIYGNSNFQFTYSLLEEEQKYYKVEIKGKYKQNVCKITIEYNQKYELTKYKKIQERSI